MKVVQDGETRRRTSAMSADVGKRIFAASLTRVYTLCVIGRMDRTFTCHESIHGTGKYPERIGVRVPHSYGTHSFQKRELQGRR